MVVIATLACSTANAQMLREVRSQECVYGDCENGRGTMEFVTPDGKAVYRGGFNDGEFNGYGRLEEPISFTQRAVYAGNWVNGRREGRGTFWDGNGNLYMGQWREDKRHGQGSYFVNLKEWNENENSEFWLARNTENYTGGFVNDLYQGQGIYRWIDGSRFEGGFFANDRHGFGTYYYPTGTAREQLWDFGDLVR